MNQTSAQRLRDNDWADAIAEINAALDAPRFRPPAPRGDVAGFTDERVTALALSAHGPEDVAWDLAQWLSRRLACDDFAALIESGTDELRRGLDAALYELEAQDLFQTFVVFYLTSADGRDARAVAPRFCLVFETWLAHAEPDLSARLRRVREACVHYRSRQPV